MRLTGTDGLAVDVNRAGATLCNAAAVLGTCDTEFVPQHPKQWHFGNDVDLALDAIDRELDHIDIPSRMIVVIIGAACSVVQARLLVADAGRDIGHAAAPRLADRR